MRRPGSPAIEYDEVQLQYIEVEAGCVWDDVEVFLAARLPKSARVRHGTGDRRTKNKPSHHASRAEIQNKADGLDSLTDDLLGLVARCRLT